jgi:hypothetical protein
MDRLASMRVFQKVIEKGGRRGPLRQLLTHTVTQKAVPSQPR